MKTIMDLEKKIKDIYVHISLARNSLDALYEGKVKMSFMAQASTETSLENNLKLLEEYETQLKEYKAGNLDELMKEEREKEQKQRENYYKYQKLRLKRDKKRTDIEKSEAISLIDELPAGISIEDEDIFEIASKSNQLKLSLHWNIQKDLHKIGKEFKDLIKDSINNESRELKIFEHIVPIIILQFYHLQINIKENIEEDKLQSFRGYPKFQNWMIAELWNTPQAYFGLYKWKNIINYLCITSDQKRVLENIFSNWIFIKKIIDDIGELSDNYNLIFDNMLKK
ncbi:MAG: hypothetical protein U9Q30_09940 [Campylobacterota bacterium]|nr:hypothetical protein [Campylobacterota bacterium]